MKPQDIKKEVSKHFDELNPTADAWSALRSIRRAALTVMSDNDKTVRIAWSDQQTMAYTNPDNGEVTRVHTNDMKNLALGFATRAEEILHIFNVPVLTDYEISQVRDPLNAKGEFASLLTFNDALATSKMRQVKIGVQDLKLVSELHLNVSNLTAIDGAGELRYTESLAHHYSQPNAFDKRTMFWEDGRLTIHYDGMWTKPEGQLGHVARKLKSAVIRTCSPRTSHIFLRCALWTKPAEVKLVCEKFGSAAAAVHMKAFVARNGCDMGSPSCAAWGRAYFNRRSVIALKLQLHDVRHIWIAVTKSVARELGDEMCSKMKAVYLEAAARLSNHSLETEDGTYAGVMFLIFCAFITQCCNKWTGEAHIAGVEGPDRQVYRKISDAFNRKVFGAEFGYQLEVSSTSSASMSISLSAASSVIQLCFTTTTNTTVVTNVNNNHHYHNSHHSHHEHRIASALSVLRAMTEMLQKYRTRLPQLQSFMASSPERVRAMSMMAWIFSNRIRPSLMSLKQPITRAQSENK